MKLEDVVIGKKYWWDGTDGRGKDGMCLSDESVVTVAAIDADDIEDLPLRLGDDDDWGFWINPAALSEIEQ